MEFPDISSTPPVPQGQRAFISMARDELIEIGYRSGARTINGAAARNELTRPSISPPCQASTG